MLLGVPAPLAATQTATVEDIIRLSRAGLRDATILKYVQAYGVCIALAPDDLVTMAEAGVSDELIESLLDVMSECPPGAPPEGVYGAAPAHRYPSSYYAGSYIAPWFFPSRFYVDHYGFFGARHHLVHRIDGHHADHRGSFLHRAARHGPLHHGLHTVPPASSSLHHRAVVPGAPGHLAHAGHRISHHGPGSGSHPGGAGHAHSISGGHGGHASGLGGGHHGGSSGGGHGH